MDRLICWSEGIDEGALSFAFRPLWQLDESAKAALALTRAQATQVYAGLKLWPDAVVARLAEAQLMADGTYPNAAAVFADDGVTADAGKTLAALDFDPTQPRDLWGRWTSGTGGLPVAAGPSETALPANGPGSQSPDGSPAISALTSLPEPIAGPHAPDGTPIALVNERGGGEHGSKKKKQKSEHGGSEGLLGRFGRFVRGLLPEEPDDPEPITPDRPPSVQKRDEPETQQPTTSSAQTEKNKLAQSRDPRIRSDLADKWIMDDGRLNWPENKGVDGPETAVTLQPGQVVDKYGFLGGNYLSPSGTPFEARSLPYDLSRTPLHTFRVLKPFVVQSGRIAPWFDEVGGGVQLRTSQDIDVLVDEEYLHED